jgi:hypothetical protein
MAVTMKTDARSRMRQNKCSFPSDSADFLLGLIFYLEDGGDMFLRKIGLSPNYMALNAEDLLLGIAVYSLTFESWKK